MLQLAGCNVGVRPHQDDIKRPFLMYVRIKGSKSGDRIPVGERFSAPVQTGPEAHPTSYTMGTGSFPGAKRPGCGVDHPPPSSAEVKERVELYLYSPPLGLRGLFYGEL
jgi:hypothetical protein